MKNRSLLETLNMVEIKWLCKYFNVKSSNYKKNMINQLMKLNIFERLQECPICLEDFTESNRVV